MRTPTSGTGGRRPARVLLLVVLAAVSVPVALVASGGPAGGAGGGTFTASLSGAQEVPPNPSTATGTVTVVLNAAETMIDVNVSFSGLTGGNASAAHIHGPASPGTNAPVIITFTGFPAATSGSYSNTFAITAGQVSDLKAGLLYVNIHDTIYPGGEIRGQLAAVPTATPPQPQPVPDPPTGVTATLGSVVVSWTPPSYVGVSGITGYVITADPGGATFSAGPSDTSLTIPCPTPGTYTFTVQAVNAYGPSTPSVPSNSLTVTGAQCAASVVVAQPRTTG